jgi:hypothetical protein
MRQRKALFEFGKLRAVAPAKRPLGRILTQGEGEVNESEGQGWG